MKIHLNLILTRMGLAERKIAAILVTPEDSDINTINYRLSIGMANLMSQLGDWMYEEDNDTAYNLLKRLQGETASMEGLPVNDGFWHCLSIAHPFEYGVKLYYKVEE